MKLSEHTVPIDLKKKVCTFSKHSVTKFSARLVAFVTSNFVVEEVLYKDGFRISGKGAYMYKGVGGSLC